VLAIVPKPTDVYRLSELVRRAADAAHALRHSTASLRGAQGASRAAQVSAQARIEESWALLRAVRARLKD
jgi:hypothetical protein